MSAELSILLSVAVIAFWLGFSVGRWYTRRERWRKDPMNRYPVTVHLTPSAGVYLHELSSLTADKAVWLARQLTKGVLFRGAYLEHRYGGQLSHIEFNRVRDELLSKGLAVKHGNVTNPSYACMAVMRHLARQ